MLLVENAASGFLKKRKLLDYIISLFNDYIIILHILRGGPQSAPTEHAFER